MTEYDATGRPVRATDAAGGETTRTYNERGLTLRETQKVQAGVVAETAYAYDDLSRETMTCRGCGGESPIEPHWFAYDIFGRKISEWDAASTHDPALRASYSYNLLDHLTREARPIGAGTTFEKSYGRDEAGRMTSLTLAGDLSPVREIAYSHLGVPLRVVSRPSESPAEDIAVSYTWDAGGRMASETDGAGGVWSYAYNRQGLLETATDPLGNVTTLEYDLEGRMVSSEVPGASSLTLTYLPTGEVGARAFSDPTQPGGSAAEAYAYDRMGRLTQAAGPPPCPPTHTPTTPGGL